jgi:flagellar L-ring protein precursor FlgH
MIRLALTLALALLATGCETLQNQPKVDLQPAQPVQYVQTAPPAAPTGGLFQAASYRPALEDPRARLPGDIVTIQITERVTASQSSSASIDRSGEASGSISAIPLFGGTSPWAKSSLGAQSSNTFAGDGKNQANNAFTGSITATVQQVLPNGHLVVVGEKQIGVNANVDVMRFSGTINPRDIRPGNVVPSTQVANARIESRNRGAQGEAMSIGWLARFFLSVLPF